MSTSVVLRRQVHTWPVDDVAWRGPRLLYLPLDRGSDPAFVDSELHVLPLDQIRAAERIVIRLHPTDAIRFFDSDERDDFVGHLSHRALGRPTSILTWRDGKHVFFGLDGRALSSDEPDLEDLRAAELWAIAQQPGCLLRPVDEFHYEGPNGSHYQGYLRPGLALLSTDILDAVAFWLLPYLEHDPTILADTGHLLALSSHAQRYRRSELAAAAGDGSDALRGYAEPDDSLRARLEGLRRRQPAEHLLVLVSVRSTGQLGQRIRRVATDLWQTINAVTLYGFNAEDMVDPEGGDATFCNLPATYRRLGKPCISCQNGVPLVQIDPHTYLLEVSAVADRKNVGIKHADPGRSFMERYAGCGAVTLHRTRVDPNEPPRHHMVHLDIGRLQTRPVFWDGVLEALRPLTGRVDVILSPSHEAAVRLAQRVHAETGWPMLISDEDQLPALDVAGLQQLRDSRNILIVDDVVSTGTRLRGYKHYLRDIGACDEGTTIHLLVGVARTPTAKALQSVEDMLKPSGLLVHVERLLLPDWREDDCPWCHEQKQLEHHSTVLSPYFVERLNRLRDVQSGLDDDVFLRWDLSRPPMRLGPRSVFGAGLNQAELFLVVSSAMQEMRSSGVLVEYPQPPIAKVLAPDGYLTGRYYEDAIDAAICRAAKRHDLRTSTMEPELMTKTGRRLVEAFSLDLRGELLFAIGEGKLPAVPEIAAAAGTATEADRPVWQALSAARK